MGDFQQDGTGYIFVGDYTDIVNYYAGLTGPSGETQAPPFEVGDMVIFSPGETSPFELYVLINAYDGSAPNLNNGIWQLFASGGEGGFYFAGDYYEILNWSEGTANFYINDIVVLNGFAYVLVNPYNNIAPDSSDYNNPWRLLAAYDPLIPGSGGGAFQGNFQLGSGYAVNDIVFYKGSSYILLGADDGRPPDSFNSPWKVFAAGGAPGSGFRFLGRFDYLNWSRPAGNLQKGDVVNFDGKLFILTNVADPTDYYNGPDSEEGSNTWEVFWSNGDLGFGNTGVGNNALGNLIWGYDNTAIGDSALANNLFGSNNTALGSFALNNTTGDNNIAVGSGAGSNLTSGSFNIAIGNSGVADESFTIRIGTPGTHTSTFIAGISGVELPNAGQVVVIDANGQLGTASAIGVQGPTGATGATGATGPAGASPFTLTGADATFTQGNVGIGTSTPLAKLDVAGLVGMGSQTGTSEPPNKAGLLVRRINSSNSAVGQIVAVGRTPGGSTMALERDGTPGGFLIKIGPGLAGAPVIAGTAVTDSGAAINVYIPLFGGADTSTQVFATTQNVAYFRIAFGDPLNSGDMTEVVLMRWSYTQGGSGYDLPQWIGTVTSTVDQ